MLSRKFYLVFKKEKTNLTKIHPRLEKEESVLNYSVKNHFDSKIHQEQYKKEN